MSSKKELKNLTSKDIPKFSLQNRRFQPKVVDIYDADTCKVIFFLDDQFVKFNCRLLGIDTPEMKPSRNKPGRDKEKIKAKQARNRLVQLCTNIKCKIATLYKKKQVKELLCKNTKIIQIICYDFDKYGRLLIEISDLDDTKTFNQVLIDEGYAYKYDGGTKKKIVY